VDLSVRLAAGILPRFGGLARRCRDGWLPNWLPSAVNC